MANLEISFDMIWDQRINYGDISFTFFDRLGNKIKESPDAQKSYKLVNRALLTIPTENIQKGY